MHHLESWLALGAIVTLTACSGQTSVSTGSSDAGDCPKGQVLDPRTNECTSSTGNTGGGGSTGGGSGGIVSPTDTTNGGEESNDGSNSPDAAGENSGDDTTQPPPDPETDGDRDGRLARFDNCPRIANPKQKDADGDGVGDKCDNFPNCANPDQKKRVCESSYDPDRDSDGDGVLDINDNCPDVANENQLDQDGDKRGDACDNCPKTANFYQKDTIKNDGGGDACGREPAGDTCGRKEKTLERLRPDVYLILDRSGSMSGSKIKSAKRALDTVADRLGNQLRFGFMAYSESCDPSEQLPMGRHSPGTIKSSYRSIRADGGTATAAALRKVRRRKLYQVPGSTNKKVVVLVTDGRPNECPDNGAVRATVSQAQRLHQDNGVDVYAIGFQSGASPSTLRRIAKAGGTSDFIEASNSQQLVKAITGIALSCEYEVKSKKPVKPGRVWVKVDGTFINRDKFSYDPSNQKVTLTKSFCQTLQKRTKSQKNISISIVAGCPPSCSKSEEICDYKDNDCDRKIDENCGGCSPEVCNGRDDDCDGQPDEGCPRCGFDGDLCQKDSNCCNGSCLQVEGNPREKRCGPPCRSTGAVCNKDSQCCSGSCSGGGERFGECRAG